MSGAEILLEPGVIPRLLQGLWVTVWIAGVSVALSVPVGYWKRFASMICWPTLMTSTTPSSTANDVVFTIRVARFTEAGSSRRNACGRITFVNVCQPLNPKTYDDSYCAFGIDSSAPRTRSPSSAPPHKTKTNTHAPVASKFQFHACAKP